MDYFSPIIRSQRAAISKVQWQDSSGTAEFILTQRTHIFYVPLQCYSETLFHVQFLLWPFAKVCVFQACFYTARHATTSSGSVEGIQGKTMVI